MRILRSGSARHGGQASRSLRTIPETPKSWRGALLTGCVALAALAALATGAAAPTASSSPATVVQLRIDGEIEPVLAEYIVNGIEQANRDHASLILITINTPGGLDTSMRAIIQAILQLAGAGGHVRESHGIARGVGRILHSAVRRYRRDVARHGYRRRVADHGDRRPAGQDRRHAAQEDRQRSHRVPAQLRQRNAAAMWIWRRRRSPTRKRSAKRKRWTAS